MIPSEVGVFGRIPGIGPKRANDLCDWRKKVEKMFRYDPKRGVDPKEVQALVEKYQEKARVLIRSIMLRLEELTVIQRQTMESRRTLVNKAGKISIIVAQAKDDLTLCV